jgi:hypothetical protein
MFQHAKFHDTSMLVCGYPDSLGTHIYVFTVESPQPVGARHISCTPLLWKPHDPSREGTPLYLATFETSRPIGQGTVHVSSYCANPAIRAGKARPFT